MFPGNSGQLVSSELQPERALERSIQMAGRGSAQSQPAGASASSAQPPPAGVDGFVRGIGDKVVTLSRNKWWKLALSILIDLIGLLSFLIPLLAEVIDVFWAPLSALLIFQLYGSSLLSGIAVIEESLPFTDIIPTATIGWLCQFTVLGAWLGLNIRESPLRPNPRFEHVE
jgi:hypothetical protein